MITRIIALLLFALSFGLFGQFGLNNLGGGVSNEPQDPTTWKYTVDAKKVKRGDVINVYFDVEIADGWKIYGTEVPKDGPLPTEFKFVDHTSYKLVGEAKSIGINEYYDEGFGIKVPAFKKKGRYVQKVQVMEEMLSFKVTIDYLACETSCLPFTHEMGFVHRLEFVKSNTSNAPPKKTSKASTSSSNVKTKPITSDCCGSTQEQLDEIKEDVVAIKEAIGADSKTKPQESKGDFVARKAGFSDIEVWLYEQGIVKPEEDWAALFLFMGLAFVSGLLALLTPCVFPLIPMTVSFFTKGNHGGHKGFGNAFLYGTFIIAIFTSVGVLFAKLFGDQIGNIIAVHWVPNLIFFIIFVVFALSFLGMFEITLPSSLVNKIDAKSEKQGIIGVFFMALTLVLVTFSCTGPIVSSILIESAGGSWLKPIAGMFAFSFALSLPFTLFAAFPSLLKGLPKSGGWLNAVKVVLGFLELALALKFLSQIDLVYGFNILDRDIFLMIWVVIFAVMGFYIFGKIKLPHDSALESISVVRTLFGIATFVFVIYLSLGLLGAPLKMMSGVLPPMHTQEFNLMQSSETRDESVYICDEPLYGETFHMPHNLQGYFDLRQAINCAVKQDKPILLDFTGKGCSNCRMFENNIWSDGGNLKLMKNNYVVLGMYGDYREPLPKGEEFEVDGEKITDLRDANQYFMKTNFNTIAMPTYVILAVDQVNSKNGKVVLKQLVPTMNFENYYDVKKFNKALKDGLKAYHQMK